MEETLYVIKFFLGIFGQGFLIGAIVRLVIGGLLRSETTMGGLIRTSLVFGCINVLIRVMEII